MSSPTIADPLATWLDFLLTNHPAEIELGLTRVSQVAEKLSLLTWDNTKVITVAGTNGKGSTCRILEKILLSAGYQVGVYSSPHLQHYNERVRVNEADASDADLIAAFATIEKARETTSLTYFEVATLTALLIFQQAKLDVIILEVGLGGRLDATNIVSADIAVITSIDLDHQVYLGTTREQVAIEKAGIFRPEKKGIVGEPDMPCSMADVAVKTGTDLIKVGVDFQYHQDLHQWQFLGENWQLNALPVPKLPLANAATALATLEQILPDLDQQAIRKGLETASLTGRLEQVCEAPQVVLDVAHNPHAARYLTTQLEKKAVIGRRYAICGMLSDKDISAVLSLVDPYIDHWVFISLDVDRGCSAADLDAALLKTTTSQQCNSMIAAWDYLQPLLTADDSVIVFGSFYTVAAFKAL